MTATFSARHRGFIAAMQVFVPYSDELAEKYPDLLTRLVPYQPGIRCAHLAGAGGAKSTRGPMIQPRPETDLPGKDAA